jgi:hypothetical protein
MIRHAAVCVVPDSLDLEEWVIENGQFAEGEGNTIDLMANATTLLLQAAGSGPPKCTEMTVISFGLTSDSISIECHAANIGCEPKADEKPRCGGRIRAQNQMHPSALALVTL